MNTKQEDARKHEHSQAGGYFFVLTGFVLVLLAFWRFLGFLSTGVLHFGRIGSLTGSDAVIVFSAFVIGNLALVIYGVREIYLGKNERNLTSRSRRTP